MIRQFVNLMVLFVMMISLSGCGTLFTGTSEMINIASEPEKAKVYVNGVHMGTTPLQVSLKRDQDHMIMVKKEGYEDASATLVRKFNPVAILNLISILCWVVDAVTGGIWKFERNALTVTMEPLTPSAAPTKP